MNRIRVVRDGHVIGSLPYRSRSNCIAYDVRDGRLVSDEEIESEKLRWIPGGYLRDPKINGYSFAVVFYWLDENGDPVLRYNPYDVAEYSQGYSYWRGEFFVEYNEALEQIPGFERLPPRRIIELGSLLGSE